MVFVMMLNKHVSFMMLNKHVFVMMLNKHVIDGVRYDVG